MFGDLVDKLFDEGKYEAARQALLNGAPMESSAWGSTRAHGLAGVHMDLEALRVFMECGGDIRTPGYGGGTILHTACWQGEYSEGSDRPPSITRAMIEFLIEEGIPLDAQDDRGNTALHEAVGGDWESPLAVQILLVHGANPDIPNIEGQTPLMAAARGHLKCTEFLLEHGADTHPRDAQGKTALEIAIGAIEEAQRKRPSLGKFLLRGLFGFDLAAFETKYVLDLARCAHLINEAAARSRP